MNNVLQEQLDRWPRGQSTSLDLRKVYLPAFYAGPTIPISLCEQGVLKGIQWLNGICSIVQLSHLFRPVAQTSCHGL